MGLCVFSRKRKTPLVGRENFKKERQKETPLVGRAQKQRWTKEKPLVGREKRGIKGAEIAENYQSSLILVFTSS